MPVRIESHGEIETIIFGDGQKLSAGDRIGLVFRAIDDPDPPVSVIIHSPNGQRIIEKVLRELPTGKPQSAPPVEFIPSTKGNYQVEVKELRGKQRGSATLTIS
jgi:hypothetical protein